MPYVIFVLNSMNTYMFLNDNDAQQHVLDMQFSNDMKPLSRHANLDLINAQTLSRNNVHVPKVFAFGSWLNHGVAHAFSDPCDIIMKFLCMVILFETSTVILLSEIGKITCMHMHDLIPVTSSWIFFVVIYLHFWNSIITHVDHGLIIVWKLSVGLIISQFHFTLRHIWAWLDGGDYVNFWCMFLIAIWTMASLFSCMVNNLKFIWVPGVIYILHWFLTRSVCWFLNRSVCRYSYWLFINLGCSFCMFQFNIW